MSHLLIHVCAVGRDTCYFTKATSKYKSICEICRFEWEPSILNDYPALILRLGLWLSWWCNWTPFISHLYVFLSLFKWNGMGTAQSYHDCLIAVLWSIQLATGREATVFNSCSESPLACTLSIKFLTAMLLTHKIKILKFNMLSIWEFSFLQIFVYILTPCMFIQAVLLITFFFYIYIIICFKWLYFEFYSSRKTHLKIVECEWEKNCISHNHQY